jgi:hypothetical protein
MAETIQVETFQVRVAAGARPTVRRGLAVAEMHGRQFIDPERQAPYIIKTDVADLADLCLQFSRRDPPAIENGSVKKLALNKNILDEDADRRIRSFRAHAAAEELSGYALVSVIDYECPASDERSWPIKEQARTRRLQAYKKQKYIAESVQMGVELILMSPGSSFMVGQDIGERFMRDVHYDLVYSPTTIEGLISRRCPSGGGTLPPNEDTGSSGSGDREPRNPSPSAPPAVAYAQK